MRLMFLLLIMMGACIQLSGNPEVTVTIENDDSNWELLAEGLEQSQIREDIVMFRAVRIDPEHYRFRAHYRPGEALSIEEWQAELPEAEVIINANFFTEDYRILGLLISDFAVSGTAYTDRGGIFYVAGNGVGIRNTRTNPYRGENFSQAIQAFPMLVENGLASYNDADDIVISRRTVIAEDRDGRIILMITEGFGMSLYDLSQYLASSDLNIQTALNLDGGGSTMMSITSSNTRILSFDPVPAVLAVYPQ